MSTFNATTTTTSLVTTSRNAVKAAATYKQLAQLNESQLREVCEKLNAGFGKAKGIVNDTEQRAIAKILADDSLSAAAAQSAKKKAAPAANKLLSGINSAVADLKKDDIIVPFKLTWSTAGDTSFKVVAVKATTTATLARFQCSEKTSADTITADSFAGLPTALLAAIVLQAQAQIDGGLKK